MTPIVRLLLISNIAVFFLEQSLGDRFIETFALWPLGPRFGGWQLLTCAFLHANAAHIFMNMFGLWMFGREVERALGSARFFNLYILSAFTASLTQLLVTTGIGADEPTLGASGAVFGVLGAFAMLFPRRIIMLLFPPIPMQARTFIFFYALIELFAGVYGTSAGIAHFAHLGGLAGGILIVRHWRRRVS